MRKIFGKLVCKFKTAREIISEPGGRSIQTSQLKCKEKKIIKNPATSRNSQDHIKKCHMYNWNSKGDERENATEKTVFSHDENVPKLITERNHTHERSEDTKKENYQ